MFSNHSIFYLFSISSFIVLFHLSYLVSSIFHFIHFILYPSIYFILSYHILFQYHLIHSFFIIYCGICTNRKWNYHFVYLFPFIFFRCSWYLKLLEGKTDSMASILILTLLESRVLFNLGMCHTVH